MDGNIYQNSPNSGYPPYAPDLSSGELNGIMPPLAPSFKHSPWAADRNVYPAHDSEQQALDRLMDSVHQGRMADVRIGQDTAKIYLEDAQVVGGAIEIRARIIPKPAEHLEKIDHLNYLVPDPGYKQPIYSYPYPNQFQPQYPYQYQSQVPLQYPGQNPYQYLNPPPVQYSYVYQYPNQFPSRYLYQYPIANAAGGIAGAISQLAFTANLLRRR